MTGLIFLSKDRRCSLNQQQFDFSVDKNNLYREETITDAKVASIRKMIPIKADGSDDTSRSVIFVGHTQLMSPQGPIPLQAQLEAQTMEEAMEAFPKAMEKTLDEVVEQFQKMQREEQMKEKNDSRIIVPGR